ncbi:MAG TPA: hypothetical protein H9951_04635 [Candidatus Bacteroides intestinigallinarum]|nr:hypothetical protein [Candidatus Bacteroides intestinigallinarum]
MKLFKNVFGAILVASFLQIGYSCSSDFHRFNDELDEIKVDGATTRGMAGHRMSLVDSVAETDEFVEYMIALNSLYKKSDEYFSKLSKHEIEMLESTAKLNNVEGLDAGVGYSDLYKALKSEMDMVVRTARILREKTDYLRLNDDELNTLFRDQILTPKRVIKKNRNPENDRLKKCEAERQAKYEQIESEATRATGECLDIEDEFKRMQCIGDVMVACNKKKARADEVYEDCIKGK